MGALERWDAFLAQIEGRHRGVRDEAEASARQFIATVAAGGDYLPMSHALMAVRSRLQELESMIIDTWHAKVSDTIASEGLGTDVRDRAYAKGLALQHALDDAREEMEPRIFAELSRQRFTHAQAEHRNLVCSGCGTPLAPPFSFRAVDVACSCGARTMFEPGELMRSVAAIGTHAVAQEAVVAEWRAMRAAERRENAMRPPRTLAVVVDVERTQIAYWRAYLGVRGQFEPELARDPAMEIRSRMDLWYRTHAEFEEAWVAAGRPRQAL